MADPEQYRSKEEVAQWRTRDPIPAFGQRLIADGVIDEAELQRIDADAIARVDAAVEFADASPFPAPGLPICSVKSKTLARVASEVFSPRMISTSGMRSTGEKK